MISALRQDDSVRLDGIQAAVELDLEYCVSAGTWPQAVPNSLDYRNHHGAGRGDAGITGSPLPRIPRC